MSIQPVRALSYSLLFLLPLPFPASHPSSEVQHVHFNGEYVQRPRRCPATRQSAGPVNHSPPAKPGPVETLDACSGFSLCSRQYTPRVFRLRNVLLCFCHSHTLFVASRNTSKTRHLDLLEPCLCQRSWKRLQAPYQNSSRRIKAKNEVERFLQNAE